MCWLCEHPEATPLDYLGHLRGLIGSDGWAVQAVRRDRLHPPWAYTVGLTEHGKPELAVTGLPSRRAGRLLDDVAAHLLHATPPEPGEQIPLLGGPLIEIVTVTEPAAHLLCAADLYGPQIRALQLVHADDRGHWPWDRGYRGVRGGQPVLGVRTARPGAAPDPGPG